MISPKQDQFLKTLDTQNLLNGYRGAAQDTLLDDKRSSILKSAMVILKGTTKKDAKTWYIRMLKVAYIQENIRNGVAPSAKEAKFLARRFTSQGDHFEEINVDGIMSTFRHFLVDSDIPAINNYQYEQQQPSEVHEQYNNFQKAHMEAKRRSISPNYDEQTILMKSGKFLFVDLGVSGSRIEGDSMGHCGNGTGLRDQRVFSLREEQSDGTVIPRATIIGNDCKLGEAGEVLECKIGEIKGYANNKVSQKYRGYIGNAISKLGIFKGKIAGAYKPEVDLSLLDFDKEQALEIIEKIPTYANPFEIAVLNGFERTQEFDESVYREMGFKGGEVVELMSSDSLSPIAVNASRAEHNSILSLGADPNAAAFTLLPQHLKDDVLDILALELGDEVLQVLTSSDDGSHISSMISQVIRKSPMLNGVFMGLTNTISQESFKPNFDKINSISKSEFGVELDSSVAAEIKFKTDALESVMESAKILSESDGNPMNVSNTYSFLGNAGNKDATARAIYEGMRLRSRFKDNNEIQASLNNMIDYQFSEQVTLMLGGTLSAFKESLRFQRSALGGENPSSLRTKESANVVWENEEYEIVNLSEGDTSKQLESVGISVDSLRSSTNYNIEREAISNLDEKTLNDSKYIGFDGKTEVLTLRKKVDALHSKTVGAILTINSNRRSNGTSWKPLYVSNIINTRFTGGGEDCRATSDAVAEYVESSDGVRFDHRSAIEKEFARGDSFKIAGVTISDNRLSTLVDGMEITNRDLLPLKAVRFMERDDSKAIGNLWFDEFTKSKDRISIEPLSVGYDVLHKMGLSEQPDSLTQVFEGATFKRNTSGFRADFASHLEGKLITMDSEYVEDFLQDTFNTKGLVSNTDSFQKVVARLLKEGDPELFAITAVVRRNKATQEKFQKLGLTFDADLSESLDIDGRLKGMVGVDSNYEQLFTFDGRGAFDEGNSTSALSYVRKRIGRAKKEISSTLSIDDVKSVIFEAMGSKLISEHNKRQELKDDNSFADSILGSISSKDSVERKPVSERSKQQSLSL